MFTVPMSAIRNKLDTHATINVRALVTDNATALTMATETTLNIIYDAHKSITMTRLDKRDTFVPGLPYIAKVFLLLL